MPLAKEKENKSCASIQCGPFLPLKLLLHQKRASLSAPQRGCISPLVYSLSLGSSAHSGFIGFYVIFSHWPEYWLAIIKKYICPEESLSISLKPSWGFCASGWPQQEEGKVFHKKMKSTTTRYNECICAVWKSPNATFQWYLDKRPSQQQKAACFLFAFLFTLPLTDKSLSHKLFSRSFPTTNFSKLN